MSGYPSVEEFAVALRDDDIPARGRKLAIDAITERVACMLAGNGTELAAPLRAVIGSEGYAPSLTSHGRSWHSAHLRASITRTPAERVAYRNTVIS